MAEYIDRTAFIASQRKIYCEDCDRRKGMKNGKLRFCYDIGDAPCRPCAIDDVLDDLEDYGPVEDVAPVRHGKWVSCGGGKRTCSECNHFAFRVVCNYCPNCGAKMDAE